MRLLTFLAQRFVWRSDTPDADELLGAGTEGEADNCLVAFVHLEATDLERGASVARQFLKHVKWQAKKRGAEHVVLHSFAHLGATDSASGEVALNFFRDLLTRLTSSGFTARATPFGHSCAWDLQVHGEPIAKVWKEI